MSAEHSLKKYQQMKELPTFTLKNLEFWHTIGQLLLTKEFTFRKTVSIKEGFPPQTKVMKNRMLRLLEQLSQQENLRLQFELFLNSPQRSYTDEQWQLVWNLLQILPILVAYLKHFKKDLLRRKAT